MAIDTKTLTALRQRTGAGLAACQAALAEANGDIEKAIEILRKKGALKAAKKSAERSADEGLIESYVHNNGKVGVLLKISCETDFVARNKEFQELAHDIALQIAATNPSYIKPEDIAAKEIAKEKEIYAEQLKAEGKPAKVQKDIIEGKLEKYYQQVCLLKQPFIKDDQLTIEKLITEKIAKLGEKIEVADFVRYHI
jgi:elongation factor Ts